MFIGVFGCAATASADDTRGTGGAAMPDPPAVSSAQCGGKATWKCPAGHQLKLRGESLRGVSSVVFTGARGSRDDRAVRPASATPTRILVTVPAGAKSGPLALVKPYAGTVRTSRRIVVTKPPAPKPIAMVSDVPTDTLLVRGPTPATARYRVTGAVQGATIQAVRQVDGAVVRSWPLTAGPDGIAQVSWDGSVGKAAAATGRYDFRIAGADASTVAFEGGTASFSLIDHIFPIRAKHDLGQSETNNFGGGRGHQGQDLFAKCGAPLVAAHGGRVQWVDFHSRAGHYVVIQRPDGVSHAYMHLQSAPLVKKDDMVFTGQKIGAVGDTGRASGCHLHFEIWTAPGWYEGGKAIDPLPELRRWDAQS